MCRGQKPGRRGIGGSALIGDQDATKLEQVRDDVEQLADAEGSHTA